MPTDEEISDFLALTGKSMNPVFTSETARSFLALYQYVKKNFFSPNLSDFANFADLSYAQAKYDLERLRFTNCFKYHKVNKKPVKILLNADAFTKERLAEAFKVATNEE